MDKINTILFDFDGTLMDTNEVIINSWQHTFRTLDGKERPVDEITRTFGEPLKITMEKMFPDVPVDKAIEIYRSYHYDNFGEMISLFPGMRNLLDSLTKDGYTLALVTSRLKGTTQQGMESHDLEKYFQAVITCEDTDKHKPDPAPILVTLERLDKKPEEAIMIGDSMFDILCAKNAGVRSVLVGWALAVTDEEKTGENGPDFMIDNAMELMDILKGEQRNV